MSLLQGPAVFLPGMLCGVLLVHVLWDDDSPMAVLLKAALGAAIGLGGISLLYFLYMLLFAGSRFFIYVQVAALLLLIWLALRRGRLRLPILASPPRLRVWGALIIGCALPVIGFAAAGAASVWVHRPFGTWDAFMIYDRSARFVYRGQADWLQTFSPDIDPAFHADYPLLIPLDIAQGWDMIGHESQSVPRVLGGVFMLACAGVFLSGLALVKSLWQAIVGLIVLLNTPFFVLSGPSQTADVPLSLFILSTIVLIFLYAKQHKPGLLVLAGLSAGLAAWTKNEGDLFLIAIFAGLLVAVPRRHILNRPGYFLAGLAVPLLIVAGFKLFLAPANDILGTDAAGLIQRVFEWPRHLAILKSLRSQIIGIGGSAGSVILLLALYALAFGIRAVRGQRATYLAVGVAAVIQAIGYYAIYLVTPHPIEWQLDFSLWRVLFHIYLPLLFTYFTLVTDIPIALGLQPEALPAETEA